MKLLITLLAFLCSASSFPFIGRWPEVASIPADTWPRIAEPGRWYHDLKNLITELYRADAQWWSKGSAFAIVLLMAALGGSVLL